MAASQAACLLVDQRVTTQHLVPQAADWGWVASQEQVMVSTHHLLVEMGCLEQIAGAAGVAMALLLQRVTEHQQEKPFVGLVTTVHPNVGMLGSMRGVPARGVCWTDLVAQGRSAKAARHWVKGQVEQLLAVGYLGTTGQQLVQLAGLLRGVD